MTLGPSREGWAVDTPGHARVPGTGRRSPGHSTVATSEGGMPACLGNVTTSAPQAPPGKRKQLRTGHQDKRWKSVPGGGHWRRPQLDTAPCCVDYQDLAGKSWLRRRPQPARPHPQVKPIDPIKELGWVP